MRRLKGFFRKYILNEELEVSHRMMNIILLVGMMVLPVCLILDIIMHAVAMTSIPLVLIFILFATVFFIANYRGKYDVAAIILTLLSSNVIIPYMYFMGGGRNSSMPLWLVLSGTFVWLLVSGWPCILVFISNIIVYGAVFKLEYLHPEFTVKLENTETEYFDMAVGVYLVIVMLGIIFKFQNRLYEKKKRELEEKEAELLESNQRLEKLSEAKSMFLASMSHEIRTPINAIVGMNEMVLRECDEKDIVEYAQNIENASGTLLSLINDILDFSKIESGLLEIIPDEYELFSVLNDCFTLLENRAKDKGLALEFINDPDIPSKLYGDEIRIRQILINLMTNAVKYTDSGTITVRARNLPDEREGMMRLCISVTDTGRGMPPEGMEHLFDSYARLDEKKNRHIEGTGLGLAITKQLIDLMEGEIEVKSTLGEGSSFIVTVPQKIISAEPMGLFTERHSHRVSAARDRAVSFKAPTVKLLAVDDVKMNLTVIIKLLKDTQIHIDTASGGRECIQKYKNEHYDIVLLDHMMPDIDGIETLGLLKETERYKKEHTPIIALTANAMLGAEKIFLDTGFDEYMTKPVKGAVLEAMILKHLPEDKVIAGSADKTEQ